jgi:hypothetical protein
MKLVDIGRALIRNLTARLVRRAALIALGGLFALAALYHFTVAGTVALELKVGVLYARLIIAGLYALAAVVTATVFWLTRARRTNGGGPLGLLQAPAMGDIKFAQLAMIVEAILLGYSLSRKSNRSNR